MTVLNVNKAPIIKLYSPDRDKVTITEEESQVFAVSASDPDGDNLTVKWLLDGKVVAEGLSYEFTANYSSAGLHSVSCIVDDGNTSVSHDWTLEVTNVIYYTDVSETEVNLSQSNVTVGYTVTFKANVYDPDGLVTAYFFDFGDGTDSGWITENTIVHTYEKEGNYEVKFKVQYADGSESDWSTASTVLVGKDGAHGIFPAWLIWLLIACAVIPTLFFLFVFSKDKKLPLQSSENLDVPVEEDPERKAVFDFIRKKPGEDTESLAAALKMPEKVLLTHLAILENAGHIEMKKDGNYKRYYPKEQPEEKASECPECGAVLDENADFCQDCGFGSEEATTEAFVCPECGESVEGFPVSCPECNVTFGSEDKAEDGEIEIAEGEVSCPECGIGLDTEAIQCYSCGFMLDSEDSPEQNNEAGENG